MEARASPLYLPRNGKKGKKFDLRRDAGFADYAAFACRLLAAHRAFIRADSLFLAAGLIWRRRAAFFAEVLTGFIGDPPLFFRAAHRAFIAAEMRLRAAALITRRFPLVTAFGGRPRRGVVPSNAAMAWSSRLSSACTWSTMSCKSMMSFRGTQFRSKNNRCGKTPRTRRA